MALWETSCLSCILAAVLVIAVYVFWAQTHWTRRGVPQTRPRFLLGDLFDTLLLRRTTGSVLADIYRRFDGKPYVGFYKFFSPVLLIRDADLVKEVLVQNFSSFQNNSRIFPEGKDDVFSDNPFFAEGERWKDLRVKFTQVFTPARVRHTLVDMIESARLLGDFLETGGKDTSHDGMMLAKRFTAHASTRVMFGIESHSLDNGSKPGVFYEIGQKIFDAGPLSKLKFIALVECPALLHILGFSFVSKDTLTFFRKLLRDSVEYRAEKNISRDDFIQQVAKQIMVNNTIDEEALRKSTAHVINTYVETFETTGLAIAGTLLLLATNPLKQEKLRNELRAHVKAGKSVDEDTVTSCAYLDHVIKESMRLYPPADTLRRMCTKATTLGGLDLQPGDVVYLPIEAIHRDPAHFSHPDEFYPEHFSEAESENRHKCAFLGFGDGPRQCPGMRYATQQVKVVIATLMLRLQVTPGPEQVLPIQRVPGGSLLGFQGGVRLRFHPVQ